LHGSKRIKQILIGTPPFAGVRVALAFRHVGFGFDRL